MGKVEWGWVDYNLVTPGVEDVGYGLRMDLDGHGLCQECGKPVPPDPDGLPRTLCDGCVNKKWPPDSGAEPAEDTLPSPASLDGELQVRIDEIDHLLQTMRSEGVTLLEANAMTARGENGLLAIGPRDQAGFEMLTRKRRGLQALRDASPDKLGISELLELWSGAAGFVEMIEKEIEASPGVMWDAFDWPPVLRDASALVHEHVKREREGVLQQAQEWWRQRLLQWPLPQVEGSPA